MATSRKPTRSAPKKTSSVSARGATKSARPRPTSSKVAKAPTYAMTPKAPTAGPDRLRAEIIKARKLTGGSKFWVLTIPWEAKGIATMYGAKWVAGLKNFIYDGGVLPAALEPYRSADYSIERWVEDELNGGYRMPDVSKNPIKPRPHQIEAIKKIATAKQVGWRGFLLADNVGIGKTYEALLGVAVAAHQAGKTEQNPAKLLIMCPKAVIPHWRNSIKAAGIKNLRVVVINYDQSRKLLDEPASAAAAKKTRTKNQRTANQGTPIIEWDYIIADEAHKMKNDGTQRTNSFSRIALYSTPAKQAPFVIWASATVGQNPLEVRYLAPLVAQMAGKSRMAVKEWGGWLIDNGYSVKETSGGSHVWVDSKKEDTSTTKAQIQALREKDVKRLADTLFSEKAPSIRRNPEDIAGWPSQSHYPYPVNLDVIARRQYQEAWEQFRKEMKMNPRGKNPAGALAAQLRFRQKASLLTVPATTDHVIDLLENGEQVALSVQFIETLDAFRERFEAAGYSVAELSGRNELVREEERLRFQRGEAQVAIFTVEEGISLHAGERLPDGSHATKTRRATVVHDIRYSGIAMTQILGRATRDGEHSFAYYMYAEDTIEQVILQKMLDKVKNMRSLSGDREADVQAIHDLIDSLI